MKLLSYLCKKRFRDDAYLLPLLMHHMRSYLFKIFLSIKENSQGGNSLLYDLDDLKDLIFDDLNDLRDLNDLKILDLARDLTYIWL